MASSALIAQVVRSGFVEGLHRGSVCATAPDGEMVLSAGDPARPVFPRSSNKPLQAVGMLEAGLDLDGELLALGCASHSGEPFHLDGVRRILASAGLDEADLRTPPDYPLDDEELLAYVAAGGTAQPLVMNCSGKHAAMLATCVAAGWPVDGYLAADHPVQLALRATVERLAGETVAAVGVDGCGAPVFALSLAGLAHAFSAIATAPEGSAEHRVATAIRRHPQWVGGTRRDVTRLLAAVPGLIAKDGAEGVFAAALPDGAALAVKVDDGAARALLPVVCAALRALGVDGASLDALREVPVHGGGAVVGSVRSVVGPPPVTR